MDFSLTEEQQIFRDSVARFIADKYSFAQRQEIVATDLSFLPEHWACFAELGWLAAPFPEEYGGLGGSPVEVMLLMEQFGRGLMVSPYLSSVVLGGYLVLLGGTEAQKQDILPKLGAGELKLAFAFAEPGSRFDLHDVATIASPDGDGYLLNGRKSVVFYAETADEIIISCRTNGPQRDHDGISLVVIDSDAAGIGNQHFQTQDGGRASELILKNVRVESDQIIGAPDHALSLIEQVIDHGIGAVCAEATGAMWSIYEQTLAYLKTREQFGQTLGTFQSLQHRMVDVYMKCELAQSMSYEATLNLEDANPVERRRAASSAKYKIAKYGRDVGQEGVQLHGGIGMTMDIPVGHYFKRLTMINATFGDAAHHLRRYHQRLVD